jgi:hypothetical protein
MQVSEASKRNITIPEKDRGCRSAAELWGCPWIVECGRRGKFEAKRDIVTGQPNI